MYDILTIANGFQPTRITTFARLRGKSSDILITSTNVISNQYQINTMMIGDKQIYRKTLSLSPDVYDLVEELNRTSSDDMVVLMKGMWTEFQPDIASIQARPGAFPAENVINTFHSLPELFVKNMENVIICLPGPTTLHATNLIKENFRAFPFLTALVQELKGCTAMKRLDIVVEIPEEYTDRVHNIPAGSFEIVLPFFELDTFQGWNLLWKTPKHVRGGQFVPKYMRDALKVRYDKMVAAQKSSILAIRHQAAVAGVGAAPVSKSLQEDLAAAMAAAAIAKSTVKAVAVESGTVKVGKAKSAPKK